MEQNKTWTKLITTLLERGVEFDLVNNVLSFKGLPDRCKGLWLWFGEIRVAREEVSKAGDMKILESFNFTAQNTFVYETK